MSHNKYPQDQNPKPSDATLNLGADEFQNSSDELARRAYFNYVNQGSLPGHDVQHWLEAEAQLLEERDLRRIHGFHNRT